MSEVLYGSRMVCTVRFNVLNSMSIARTEICESHTDRKLAAHIPAKMPYRVDCDISRGPGRRLVNLGMSS